MKPSSTLLILSFAMMTMIVAGCADDNSSSPEATVPEIVGPETAGPPNTMDGHAHPTEGPHHGDLVELGNEEYHAEILHVEDSGMITIYVLNGAATEQVPIDATEVTINAKHEGQPEQFTLTASPDATDPQGKSSRFISNDQELAHCLDEEGAGPRLVLTINGKSYRGKVSHNHSHAGHGH